MKTRHLIGFAWTCIVLAFPILLIPILPPPQAGYFLLCLSIVFGIFVFLNGRRKAALWIAAGAVFCGVAANVGFSMLGS